MKNKKTVVSFWQKYEEMGQLTHFERECKIFSISQGLFVPTFKPCIPFDPRIPFLIIYLKEIRVYKYAT